MRKIIGFIVFIAIAGGYYFFIYNPNATNVKVSFRDDFETINREFWFVGEWQTNDPKFSDVKINDGILSLKVEDTDRGPYLLSKPLAIEEDYVISIKRRVKINYANDYFTGGLALFQTDSADIRPNTTMAWKDSFGDAAVLVEYVHNYNPDNIRPGRDIFRVLPPTWEVANSARLIKPIFDEWFEEKLIYDMRMNRISYIINGEEYHTSGFKLDRDYVRFFMHSYGWYTGHNIDIDWIEVEIRDESIDERGKSSNEK